MNLLLLYYIYPPSFVQPQQNQVLGKDLLAADLFYLEFLHETDTTYATGPKDIKQDLLFASK